MTCQERAWHHSTMDRESAKPSSSCQFNATHTNTGNETFV